MPREVTDKDGLTWTCVQAYAGLSNGTENEEAARLEGTTNLYRVVCTPSGGAKSVRIELQGDWEDSLSDEDLLREIATHQDR